MHYTVFYESYTRLQKLESWQLLCKICIYVGILYLITDKQFFNAYQKSISKVLRIKQEKI